MAKNTLPINLHISQSFETFCRLFSPPFFFFFWDESWSNPIHPIPCALYSYTKSLITAAHQAYIKRRTTTHTHTAIHSMSGGETLSLPMGLRKAGGGASRWQRAYPITEIKAVDWWIMNINWMLFAGVAMRCCGEWESELMHSCWRDGVIVGGVYTPLR